MFKEWKAIFKKPTFYHCNDRDFSHSSFIQHYIFIVHVGSYGQVSELPVAVVNKDKEASYNGQTMRIGEDMVSNLKENKALDFHFVNEEEGEKGLEDGGLLHGSDFTK